MEMNRQGNVAPDGEVLHPSLSKEAKETAEKLRALAQSDRLAFWGNEQRYYLV